MYIDDLFLPKKKKKHDVSSKFQSCSFQLSAHWLSFQVHGESVQGRILHGHSPSDLIESFTEIIGRPPELPGWITSGAVVGMQGGTDAVRGMWDQLKKYDVPISAFWLQVKLRFC